MWDQCTNLRQKLETINGGNLDTVKILCKTQQSILYKLNDVYIAK